MLYNIQLILNSFYHLIRFTVTLFVKHVLSVCSDIAVSGPEVGTKLEGLLFEDLVEPAGTPAGSSSSPPAICE